MKSKDYLSYIVDKIHSTVAATVDDDGLPVTCAIDMMDCDGESLYFLTAKGKGVYSRLKNRGYIALTGMKGEDTMSRVAVSVRGRVQEIGPDKLPDLFAANPYMNDIYPNEASRQALTVFRLYEGSGEWFDLSQKPIERESFVFGGAEKLSEGYFINGNCIGCKLCYSKCPTKCIDVSVKPAVINAANCLHCGNCYEICPARAVEKRNV